MAARILFTDITGQDGSTLAELLLGKCCELHGRVRRPSAFNTARIDHPHWDIPEKDAQLFLHHHGDMANGSRIVTLLDRAGPEAGR